jgi:hypothetical protein
LEIQKMKKTLIVIALASISSAASATDPVAAGSISGSATSSVSGVVLSGSSIMGVNQFSGHGAAASAENCTIVTGTSAPGSSGAVVNTNALSFGNTSTQVGGINSGGAYAGAGQGGKGDVTSLANVESSNVLGAVSAHSLVDQGTWSSAEVANSGYAESGSSGIAANTTHASIGSSSITNGVSTSANGKSKGYDNVKSWGDASSGDLVNAGGGSYQTGDFSGTITRSFVTTVKTDGQGPGGCTVGCSSGGNNGNNGNSGNNGYGNGDQDAPGGSGDHNGAENDKTPKNHK